MPWEDETMKLERMGDKVIGVKITGDRRNAEKEAFRITFPWGEVEVTRATDGGAAPDYWVHVYVNNPRSPHFCVDEDSGSFAAAGVIKDARLDQTDRHASESNVGDFTRPELYHLAVRVGQA
jgi:hypothetical protein